MNSVKKQIGLIFLYVILFFGTTVYFAFFRFSYPRYASVNKQIKAKQAILGSLTQILNGQSAIDDEYDAFVEKFKGNLNDPAATEILKDIKTKAGSAGLNVINIKPFPLKDDKGTYKEFDFKLETEGQLKNLGRFLYTLDKSPYMFSIKNTQINAQSESEPLKVQLLLSALISKEQFE